VKFPKSLVSLLIIATSFSWIVSLAHASSITREYDVDFMVVSNEKYLTFHTKMIIETEPNGEWKTNTFYQIDYIISLTYVNESLANGQEVSLFFYNPMLLVDDWIFGTGDYKIIKNSTSVWIGHDGTLTIKYSIKGGDRLQLKAMLNYQILKDNKMWFPYTNALGMDWRSQEPIWIDIEKETATSPDYTVPLLYTAIGVAIVIIPLGTYLIYKSKKPQQPHTT